MSLPTVLTIAGSDPSGGAGIQADCKSIHALGGYALSVATALTAQNSQGVQGVYPVSADAFKAQLDSLLADYQIDAVKIGMLAEASKIETVSELLENLSVPVVLDPVLVSSSGTVLLQQKAIQNLTEKLLPQVTLVTPNLPEAQLLLKQAGFNDSLQKALQDNETIPARAFAEMGIQNLLLKGGHQTGSMACDALFEKLQSEPQIHSFCKPRLQVQHSHGTGCTLSSAIATFLARGETLPNAVQKSKQYLHQTLAYAGQAQPHYRSSLQESERKGGLNHFLMGMNQDGTE
ncbi:bifunctional hydroxymethylpyrimidine kinase/phosphomethylpyrimidine kinase [Thiomicrorhabdus sp. 6S3-12]|uniref:bifunctional hydroxymethylpyrimidine kinase/phosphomethylpyrimidine kinase n=1 Tax=Thiomicrorhabdus sp. 6S3-12 TaxID=2819681 RepID=UPI001AAC90E2|nr:bifunctional hydroxymethylpyrimidine kinase/phosphomethylpyrimidine kinase [Thiomicrorhabdus sp. 6S3-12]MBO1924625.1 bifunctional hydroxymethylpyrimidine kinase/phosphomethylpyrimidine kinase [Thiomicrorhabdus sp. 6S3-12]